MIDAKKMFQLLTLIAFVFYIQCFLFISIFVSLMQVHTENGDILVFRKYGLTVSYNWTFVGGLR